MLVVYGQQDNIWYKKSPLGKNEIGKQLSKAAQNNCLQWRLANNSVYKTFISMLLNSDVPVNYVAQLSDYQNFKSSIHANHLLFNISEESCLHWIA